MTANRVFIIALVLIAVLFAITLVWAHRDGDSSPSGSSLSVSNLVENWKGTFQNLGRMNPEDVLCPQRRNSTITFPPGVPVVQATIKRASDDRVRRLNLVMSGPGIIKLNFAPKPGDDRATANPMDLRSGKTNTLAVFPPGGLLTLTRSLTTAPATIEIR